MSASGDSGGMQSSAPALTVPALILGAIVPLILLSKMWFVSKKWAPRGKHCFVTGGSSGTGIALAVMLVQHGAHVSIVARNEERLQTALSQLEKHRRSSDQIIEAYSFAVDSEAAAAFRHEAWVIANSFS
ncbi:hypothetical protein NUW54_g1539 [Trametes sanguinea]|uniref:Uncharacterized protein n=1 Tax=Trametes sanguinea TaxID=158606 RepID=A0ACC1Q6P4_9APHY|nr:hypothetical protein NUW54_g1539 [Trametes sanguinea]